MRVFQPGFVLLFIVAMLALRPQVNAQTAEEAEVYLETVGSTPSAAGAPLTLAVIVENLQHEGSIGYDDNRDTVPDRHEPSLGLGAFEFEITFNATMLRVDGAELGAVQQQSDRNFQCFHRRDRPGHFAFGCVSFGAEPPGPQGDLELAAISIIPIGSGSTALELEATLAGPLADDIAVRVIKTTTVAFQGGPAAGSETPRAGGENSATPESKPPFVDGTPGVDQPSATVDPSADATSENGGTPEDPSVRALDSGSGDDPLSTSGGSSAGSIALWSAAAGGGLAAAGALGLAAVRWRRKQGR